MALIECPDCGKQVSESAPSCPGCGRPMTATTVEQTSKTYKGWQVIGFILFVIGMLGWIAGHTAGGVSILVAGTAVYVWARMGAWWDHG